MSSGTLKLVEYLMNLYDDFRLDMLFRGALGPIQMPGHGFVTADFVQPYFGELISELARKYRIPLVHILFLLVAVDDAQGFLG